MGRTEPALIMKRCKHCDNWIRRSPDPNLPWVHDHSGNSFCDVWTTSDAVHNRSLPNRTEAKPS